MLRFQVVVASPSTRVVVSRMEVSDAEVVWVGEDGDLGPVRSWGVVAVDQPPVGSASVDDEDSCRSGGVGEAGAASGVVAAALGALGAGVDLSRDSRGRVDALYFSSAGESSVNGVSRGRQQRRPGPVSSHGGAYSVSTPGETSEAGEAERRPAAA